MNKNLKRIVSTLFALGMFGGIAPLSDLELMTTKVYANDSDGVTSIEIETSNGDERNLYTDSDCKSSDKIDDDELDAGNTYYATSPSDTIEVNVSGVNSNYVRVFNGTSGSDEGESEGSSIDLSSGTTVITVRVYSNDPGDVEYSDDSYISQYKIRVEYTGDDDIDDDESDNVYLKTLSIEGADIDFKMRTYTYDINIPEDYSKITIGARPNADSDDYDDYKVKINGVKVDQDEKFKDDVKLNAGVNIIEISVEDDDDNERIYTLNITKGKVTNSNNSSSGNVATGAKTNQWAQVNGKWQYNDGTGNVVKNMWVGNYYLQANGDMAMGWLNYSGSWYYLGIDGAKKIGWQFADENWYYLDSNGKIKTGWFKDSNGKWYYLNSFGAMAYNTVVDGYRLGNDGGWTN